MVKTHKNFIKIRHKKAPDRRVSENGVHVLAIVGSGTGEVSFLWEYFRQFIIFLP